MPTRTSDEINVLAPVPTTTGAMDINQPYPPHYFQQKLYPFPPDTIMYIIIALKAKTSTVAIKHQTFTGNVTMVKQQ